MNLQVFALTKKEKKTRLIEDYIESTMICHLLFFLSEVMALVYMYCHRNQGGSIQGDIVQIDTEATLRHRDPSKGLHRFSFNHLHHYVCQVNQEKVVVEKLRRDQDLLYFVDSYQLRVAVFVKYYEDSGYLLLTSLRSKMYWKKQLNEVYYSYSFSGKDANDKSPFFRQLTETKRN